jgi:uncharacterized repeat protein (TIGR01451 family)
MIRMNVPRPGTLFAAALLASVWLGNAAGLAAAPTVPAAIGGTPEVAAAPTLEVTLTAELEQVKTRNGRVSVQLLPADHVVPGDSLIYTLMVRNSGSIAVLLPQFTAPIPRRMSYIADSAVAPGAEILYSVDGGVNFDKPQNLRVSGEDGVPRLAAPADYTHIRWTLRHSLNPNSVVFARFRARLN